LKVFVFGILFPPNSFPPLFHDSRTLHEPEC
jgi:hypothetical protein